MNKIVEREKALTCLSTAEQHIGEMRAGVEQGSILRYIVLMALTDNGFVCLSTASGHAGQVVASLHLTTLANQYHETALSTAKDLLS